MDETMRQRRQLADVLIASNRPIDPQQDAVLAMLLARTERGVKELEALKDRAGADVEALLGRLKGLEEAVKLVLMKPDRIPDLSALQGRIDKIAEALKKVDRIPLPPRPNGLFRREP